LAQRGLGLLKHARLTRKQLIGFALLSAILNGVITASVGAWLGQTYARYQARRQSIESLVHLVYERRTRAGMVASALKRGADIDEVRFRKRAYDEAYVEWNKNIMQNIFAIREVTGEHMISSLEGQFQDGLVAAMSDVDRCLTKAYDARLANSDPKVELDKCHMSEMHQFVLDCGATFTNELYKLTKLTFTPFGKPNEKEGREVSEKRIKGACTQPPPKSPAGVPAPQPAAPSPAAPGAETVSTPPAPTAVTAGTPDAMPAADPPAIKPAEPVSTPPAQ
jgi:hypothetical protein